MATDSIVFTCQYFLSDSNPLCKNWSVNGCSKNLASHYPNCNYIGTATKCTLYSSSGVVGVCGLPNPSSHICNRTTGSKWQKSEITEYNNGKCDGKGTSKACTGYSPGHLSFGPVKYSADGTYTQYELPINYKILNIRAKLSKCSHWEGASEQFLVETSEVSGPAAAYCNVDGTKFKILPIEFRCELDSTTAFSTHNGLDYPCNGSHTNCPSYTGVCWKYVTNNRLKAGNKILAEQYLELRHYLRGSKWTKQSYLDAYKEPYIYSWKGIINDINDKDIVGSYPVARLSLNYPDYNNYLVNNDYVYPDLRIKHMVVTDGTHSLDGAPPYPSLVNDLSDAYIVCPDVCNFFEVTSAKELYIESGNIENSTLLLYGSINGVVTEWHCIDLNNCYKEELKVPTFFKEFVDYYELYNYFLSMSETESRLAEVQVKITEFIEEALLFDDLYCYSNVEDFNSTAFYFNVNPSPGENSFIILAKVNDLWTFSILNFTNVLVGGLLYQTYFTRECEDGVLSYLPDYSRSFGIDTVKIGFQYCNISYKDFTSAIGYVYNDYLNMNRSPLNISNIIYTGYDKYKAVKNFELTKDNFRKIGSSPTVAINIPDVLLTDVIDSWSIERAYIVLEENTIEFDTDSIFKLGSLNGLAVNQAILKVKEGESCSLCKDHVIILEGVTCTFKESSSEELVKAKYLNAGWAVSLNNNEGYTNIFSGNFEVSASEVSVSNFDSGVNMACISYGRSGKLVGHTKTKPILFIKQPYCPDVEMLHRHSAKFRSYKNLPTCYCWQDWKAVPKQSDSPTEASQKFSTPPCGDHAVNMHTRHGLQFYPYVQCGNFSQYNRVTNQAYGSQYEIKGPYTGDHMSTYGHVHGLWDIRMEGPDDWWTWTGTYCPPRSCYCHCETGNIGKIKEIGSGESTGNRWAGWARYRGEVDNNTLNYWLNTGGGQPRFGNVTKPFLRSYRSSEFLNYVYTDLDGEMKEEWKWLPCAMDFTYPYLYSNDVIFDTFSSGEGPQPINMLGMSLFMGEGPITVKEKIKEGFRYRFEEVFNVKKWNKLVYPVSIGSYYRSNGLDIVNIVYEFKDIDGKQIQWAWRDNWAPIERSKDPIFLFNISYPDYIYDQSLVEHRLVADEGESTIMFIAPLFDEYSGELKENAGIRLNEGPIRYFNKFGVFDPAGTNTTSLYKTCTSSPWQNISIFDTDYISTSIEDAENDGRMFLTDEGSASYYQRGLMLSLDLLNSYKLPYIKAALPNYDPSIYTELSELPCNIDNKNIVINFEAPKFIIGVKATFRTGVEHVTIKDKDTIIVYDSPSISIESNDQTEASTYGFGEISTGLNKTVKEVTLYLDPVFADFFNRANSKILKIRTLPTETEVLSNFKSLIDYEYFTEGVKKIRKCTITNLTLIEGVLIDKTESIKIYERKFIVSTGGSVAQAPQGTGDAIVLRPLADDFSTVWQSERDGLTVGIDTGGSTEGKAFVVGNKCRSRFVKETRFDKKIIDSNNVSYLESTQQRLFNEAIEDNTQTILFKNIHPPKFKEFMEANNLNMVIPDSLVLTNTSIRKLGTLKQYDTFSGKGYKLEPSLPYQEGGMDCWNYVLINMDTGKTRDTGNTGLYFYYWGTINLLWRRSITNFIGQTFNNSSSSDKIFEEDQVDTSSSLLVNLRPFFNQSSVDMSTPDLDQYSIWYNKYKGVDNLGGGWDRLWSGVDRY